MVRRQGPIYLDSLSLLCNVGVPLVMCSREGGWAYTRGSHMNLASIRKAAFTSDPARSRPTNHPAEALAYSPQQFTLSHVSASSRVPTGEYLEGYHRSDGRESDDRGDGYYLPRGAGTLHAAYAHCRRGETAMAEDRPSSPADFDHHVFGSVYRQKQYRSVLFNISSSTHAHSSVQATRNFKGC